MKSRTNQRARRHPRRLGVIALTVALALATLNAATGKATAAEDVDIMGTWFVLIHFHDENTANPEADRWKDLVWKFGMRGSRLEWREYPLVIFDDTSGRFEAIKGNPRSRTLRRWEPNEEQLAVISAGPRVNDRGSKTKTLRGSAQRGWKSSGRMNAQSGAMVIGYQETVSIENPTALPVFSRSDVLGNAFAKSDEGRTEYKVNEVRDGGDTLLGEYERDGSRKGVFRMWRTPDPRGLVEKEGTVNERYNKSRQSMGGLDGLGGGGSNSGDGNDGFGDDDF